MNTSLLFSGQGSQYVGMAKDLYSNFGITRNMIDNANEILGRNLSEILFEGPVEILKETRNTQPALFLHSAVLFELLKNNIEFRAVAGHSVGEYAALFASGALNFEDALKLVSLRGELMFNAGEILPGTMFAVIGLDDEKVAEICNQISSESEGVIVPANFNSPGQVVVSGTAELLRNNASKFKEAGAKMVSELVVSGAFHSPLMEPARQKLAEAINNTKFQNANVPVFANVDAKPHKESTELKEALIMQLTSPVLWSQTLVAMKNDGFENYIELGPGKVLQGLVKRTILEVQISGFDKSDDVKKILSQ